MSISMIAKSPPIFMDKLPIFSSKRGDRRSPSLGTGGLHLKIHSTVTDLARFLGLSTSQPRLTAT